MAPGDVAKREMFGNGQTPEECTALGDLYEAKVDSLMWRHAINTPLAQANFARSLWEHPRESAQEGCLAGGIWAEEPYNLARQDLHIEFRAEPPEPRSPPVAL